MSRRACWQATHPSGALERFRDPAMACHDVAQPCGDPARGDVVSEYLGKDGGVGAPSTLRYSLEAVGRGETTIELLFSYRGSTDEADTLSRVDVPRPRLEVTGD